MLEYDLSLSEFVAGNTNKMQTTLITSEIRAFSAIENFSSISIHLTSKDLAVYHSSHKMLSIEDNKTPVHIFLIEIKISSQSAPLSPLSTIFASLL